MGKMPEKHIIGLILGAILIVVVLAYFILEIMGFEPDTDIFPRGKETVVRYYTCSLAICNKGCEAGSIVEEICLDNDTVTNECNLWCNEVCLDRFKEDCKEAGDCCGIKWNLSVSLSSNPSIRGCYGMYEKGDEYFYNTTVYDIAQKLFPTFFIEGEWGEFLPNYGCMGQKADAFEHYAPGFIFDEIETLTWREPQWQLNTFEILGQGGIFLDPLQAREEWGCYDENVPVWGGLWNWDAPGFYHCVLKGNINMYAMWQGPDFRSGECSDVYFTQSLTDTGSFEIDAWGSAGEECEGKDWCERIELGEETAEYTVRISNYLGSGKIFRLKYIPSPSDPVCEFIKDSNTITEIFVDSGDSEVFTMKCDPTEASTYNIEIIAETTGLMEKATNVKLKVVDFEFEVTPLINDPPVEIGGSTTFQIRIQNLMGEDANFDLRYEAGDDVTCNLVSDSFSLADDEWGNTQMDCSASTEGNHYITVYAGVDGFENDLTVVLDVSNKCQCKNSNDACKFSPCYDCVSCSDIGICKDGTFYSNQKDADEIYCCEAGDCNEYDGGSFCYGIFNEFWTCHYDAQSCANDKCEWITEDCGRTLKYEYDECDEFCDASTGCKLCTCDPWECSSCEGCIVCNIDYSERVCDGGTELTRSGFGLWNSDEKSLRVGKYKGCCNDDPDQDWDCPDWYCFDPDGGDDTWYCFGSVYFNSEGPERPVEDRCLINPDASRDHTCLGGAILEAGIYGDLDMCRAGCQFWFEKCTTGTACGELVI